MRRTNLIKVVWTATAAVLVTATVGLVSTANAAGGPNLSLGKTASASTANGPYAAGNLNDGNQGTYWEGVNNSFPQWAQIDLGAGTSIDQVVLKLPAGWGSRSQTLSVQGSPDGAAFSAIVAPAAYTFNPVVTIDFPATSTRFVRINITANTGWPAAQLSELEITAPATRPATSPRAAPPPRAGTPTSTTRPGSSTATKAAIGKASTTPSRNGSRSTSAHR